MMRLVVLDTETTGLSHEAGHRVIEIGCIEMIDRKLTGKKFHYYLNPERDIEDEAVAVHGITREFLQDKPIFSQIAAELMDFINGCGLVIHNAAFDTGFIDAELARTGKTWKKIADHCQIIDTLPLARQLHVGQRNTLDALCKRYGIDNSQRELHGALLDAHLLARVYLAMTGGQGSLFGGSNTMPAENQKGIKKIVLEKSEISVGALKVVRASADEMLAHDLKLQEMQKTGKCVWLETL